MKKRIIGYGLVLLLAVSAAVAAQSPGLNGIGAPVYYSVRSFMTRWMPIDGFQTTTDVNPRGDMMVAQALPERSEIVRMGNSWAVQDTTGVAAVIALPTTTASNTFWNGEPDGGKTYLVDRVWCYISTSAAAATAHSIVGVVNKGPVAAPTAVTLTVSTLNGRNYAGKIVVARSATITDDRWWPLPGPSNSNSNLGAGTTDLNIVVSADVNGLIQIPPRHQFSVALMAVNTTAVGKCGMMWHEVQLPVVY